MSAPELQVGDRVKITWGALNGTFGTYAGLDAEGWFLVVIENPFADDRALATVPVRANAIVQAA